MRNNTVQLEYLLNNKLKIRPIIIIISVKKWINIKTLNAPISYIFWCNLSEGESFIEICHDVCLSF